MILLLDVLAFSFSVLVLLVIPGSLLLRFLRSYKQTRCSWVLTSFGLSLCFLSLVGIALNYTVGISALSLRLVYGFLAITWLVIELRYYALPSKREPARVLLDRIRVSVLAFTGARSKLLVFLVGVLVLGSALVRWSPYYDYHSADAGWHVFWARNIMNTQHLPDYNIVQPYNPPQIFAFGSHLLLASFSLLVDIPLENMFWLPLVLFYFLIFLAVFELSRSLLNSYWAGLVASALFSTSQIPAGRVFLGNLPDLAGYFLLILTLLLLREICLSRKLVVVFGLVAPSIIAFYQYATLSTALTLASFFVLLPALQKDAFQHLRKMINTRVAALTVFLLLTVTLVLACHTTYMNTRSLEILGSTNWSAYVPDIGAYHETLGPVNVALGFVGLIMLWLKNRTVGLLISSWFMALIAATNAPMFGIGVEPVRFLWHLIEPLSITGGIAVYLVVSSLTGDLRRSFGIKQVQFTISYSNNRSRLVTRFAASAIAVLVLISAAVSSTLCPVRAEEPYLHDDVRIGLWLASISLNGDVVAIDADADPTATWVQAYSQIPLFLYKADFAVGIASPPYSYFYENVSRLFDNPFSPNVMQIASGYNLSYIVSHGIAVEAFSLSPFFAPVHMTSSAAVFKPEVIGTYGVVTFASGYRVTMTSGREAFVLSEINIVLHADKPFTLILPVYGQIALPILPNTAFAISVDESGLSEYTIQSSDFSDTSLALATYFGLEKIGAGDYVLADLPLAAGLHTLKISKTSDVGFVLYADDLKAQGISGDPSLLVEVPDS